MSFSYRTRRRLQRLGIALLILLILVVIAWFCCVVWLERYVVYTRDGAVLDFDLPVGELTGELAIPPAEDDAVEIYYVEGDNAEAMNKDLTQMKGYYIDAKALAGDISAIRDQLTLLESGTPVMIDVKSIYGTFYYTSDLLDASPATNVDISAVNALIDDIFDRNFYAIARLPAFKDRNFGLNHVESGLPLPQGYLWMDSDSCYWLDPTDGGTINWLTQIVEELKRKGFDEVVFSNFCFPNTDKIVFNQDRSAALQEAAGKLMEACGSEYFTLSFTSTDINFPLPEGRSRLYVENVEAKDVAATAAQSTLEDPRINLVFVAVTNDTRYNEYSVLRPLDAAEALEAMEAENE